MNLKRWLHASLAALAVILGLEIVLYSTLLQDMYRQTAAVWRPGPDLARLMPLLWAGMAVSALFFTLIYAQGYERHKAGVVQGMRFGLYMGLFYFTLYGAVAYVVLPIPAVLAAWWFLGGIVEYVAAGAIVGWMYRTEQPT